MFFSFPSWFFFQLPCHVDLSSFLQNLFSSPFCFPVFLSFLLPLCNSPFSYLSPGLTGTWPSFAFRDSKAQSLKITHYAPAPFPKSLLQRSNFLITAAPCHHQRVTAWMALWDATQLPPSLRRLRVELTVRIPSQREAWSFAAPSMVYGVFKWRQSHSSPVSSCFFCF